jgi:dTMP kinase
MRFRTRPGRTKSGTTNSCPPMTDGMETARKKIISRMPALRGGRGTRIVPILTEMPPGPEGLWMKRNRAVWNSFVAIEGIDGAGTTTLSKLLGAELTRRNVPHTRGCEPTDGPIGKLIREGLSGRIPMSHETLALLFSADRREHLFGSNGIKHDLDAGRIAITDRYFFSSLAYQTLHAEWDWVDFINGDYPLPGYLIYLSLPVEDAQKRISKRIEKEIYEKTDIQRQVADCYRRSIDTYRDSGMRILELDSREPADVLCDESVKFLNELFQ